MREIAILHISALPHTLSSRLGIWFVESLYKIVEIFGCVKILRRDSRVVGVMSSIGRWILTLAVEPKYQRQGIGRELVEGLKGKIYVYTESGSFGFYQKLGFEKFGQMGKIIFLCRE